MKAIVVPLTFETFVPRWLGRRHRVRSPLAIGVSAAALLSLAVAVERADACPKCRLGASALTGSQPGESPWDDPYHAEHTGDADPHAATDSPAGAAADPGGAPPNVGAYGPLHPFQLTGGVNVTTAYYHRGYLQEDQGVIVQPHLTLGYTAYESKADGFSLTPYVSWWNSLHDEHTFTDGDYDLWYESELMAAW